MSVRKRQWYTRKQIQSRAMQMAKEAGGPGDEWPRYVEFARTELNELLRKAAAEDAEAIKALRELPSKLTPRVGYVVDYHDQAGTRCFATFARKKDADDYHATVKVEVRKGTHTAPSKSPTVEQAADAWIKGIEAEGREWTTVRQYRQHAKLHIVPRIGRYKLAELSEDRIDAFRADLLANLSRPMARKVLTSFKSLLKSAKYAHLALYVKAIGRDKRAEHKLEIGVDVPTTAEISRIGKAATEPKLRALLLTAALTGLRASELRGLRWKDVHFDSGELSVVQRADRRNKIGPPKSKAGRRTIPLDSATLVPALKSWRKICPAGDLELVFPTSSGNIEHHANMLRSIGPVLTAAKVVDKAGEPKYALHAFRHFFASWCINPKDRGGRGLTAQVVQYLLGHSSIVMTMDIYGHLFPEKGDRAELAAAARALFA